MFNIKNNKSTEAFTLVELIVVMAIIGIAGMLGVWGMLTFQRSIELRQASEEVLSVIRETQNKAENNVLPNSVDGNSVYGYRLRFDDDDMARRLCQKRNDVWSCAHPSSITEEINLKSNLFTQIKYDFDPNCNHFIIGNLTGEIWIPTGTPGQYTQTGFCEIEISRNNTGAIIRLQVDATNDIVTLET